MDEQLLARLDQQDWEDIIGKLTLAALNQLKLCGLSRDKEGNAHIPSGTHPQGYALDAVTKVYEACVTGTNKWDPERGDLYPFLERLVRRLITDDKKKYSKRPSPLSYDEQEATLEMEQSSSIHLNALFDAADEGVQELILVLQEHVDADGGVHWGDVREQLGVSKHEMTKRRERLASLMEHHDLHRPMEKPHEEGSLR